jgi:hypothetical protein
MPVQPAMAVNECVEAARVFWKIEFVIFIPLLPVVNCCTGPMATVDPGPMIIVPSISKKSVPVRRRNVVVGTAAVSAKQ